MKMSRTIAFAAPLLLASPAFAHPGHGNEGSFLSGFLHPIGGLDHVLAMVAVGLWAVVLGGRALWALPAAFVGAMVVGFVLSLAGLPLPLVEPMILASILALGGLTALARPVALPVAAAIVGALALFHGHAHGSEMAGASALAYLAGFASATALLHGTGVAFGVLAARPLGLIATRVAGGLIALGGAALVIGG
ncbi:MAG: urease accessory protein UreJ [Roseibaca calidilacus]|uniref:Urease accessory protein n=1 Tax=Roseibaca calidilacus TaxID=1666912 RepID=A0A0N8K777_9RHOB|nr:HupE/UreJ family protein [Roseibaca calidilacus]KPP90969.1 MAG: urease accessory protein UreJ [Roseibaca calidilacus]CUX83896.1 urease accessory protein [Roseibaca calidilacus]